jgi:glycine cleavage system H lipoate-binding protein
VRGEGSLWAVHVSRIGKQEMCNIVLVETLFLKAVTLNTRKTGDDIKVDHTEIDSEDGKWMGSISCPIKGISIKDVEI